MTYKTRFQYLFDRAKDIAHGNALINPAALPPLFFFTDPARLSHPEDIAEHLPAGCGLVYRHFGEAHALQRARLLRRIASERGLTFLIGEDEALAAEVEADGLHLRQHSLPRATDLHEAHPHWWLTGACHDVAAVKSADVSVLKALFISPVFASQSASAAAVEPLGIKALRGLIEATPLPVYGLGGITCDNVGSLRDTGLSGIAAVEAFRLVD